MSKMIQIRNVPDELHRELKIRAARAGMTLSDFLLREVARVAARPPVEDVLKRVASREHHDLAQSMADEIRAERDSR